MGESSGDLRRDPFIILFGLDSVWDGSPLRELIDLADPDLRYVVDAIRLMRVAGFDMADPEAIRLAVEAGHRKAAAVHDDSELIDNTRELREWFRAVEREIQLPGSCGPQVPLLVYYMRLGNRCKIGWTSNLRRRMAEIQPEELLVTEPGGLDREAERHGQFKALRVVGEWFRYEGTLVEHATTLRQRST